MKQLFKYTAEHISRGTGTKFVRQLESEDVDVMHAMMDPVFENQFIMFVNCTDAEAKVIKNRLWELNNGAYNEMIVTTADELEEYI